MNVLELKNRIRPIVDRVDPDRQLRNIFRTIRQRSSDAVSASDGNGAIARLLCRKREALIGRVGASEMKIVNRYLLRQRLPFVPYTDAMRKEIRLNSGFCPVSDDDLDRFASFYLDCASDTDIFCAWFIPGEARVIERSGCKTVTVLPALEPFRHESPWSLKLKGRTVLVVSPFIETFRQQTARLNDIWGYDLFPDVEFKFVRFPHSQALRDEGPTRPWFDIVEEKQAEIAEISFDVGFVGAGAATLPLARHMKRIGRTGFAIGGALQLFFGVRGRRWDIDSNFQPYFNQHWVRPLPSETPPKFKSNESGAYW
jgi:hypothetical protein